MCDYVENITPVTQNINPKILNQKIHFLESMNVSNILIQ